MSKIDVICRCGIQIVEEHEGVGSEGTCPVCKVDYRVRPRTRHYDRDGK
jgi:hypothetical protein